MTEPLDLDEIKPWLALCGYCDAGLPMACTHLDADYRPVMLRLVREVERLRLERDEAYGQGRDDEAAGLPLRRQELDENTLIRGRTRHAALQQSINARLARLARVGVVIEIPHNTGKINEGESA